MISYMAVTYNVMIHPPSASICLKNHCNIINSNAIMSNCFQHGAKWHLIVKLATTIYYYIVTPICKLSLIQIY